MVDLPEPDSIIIIQYISMFQINSKLSFACKCHCITAAISFAMEKKGLEDI